MTALWIILSVVAFLLLLLLLPVSVRLSLEEGFTAKVCYAGIPVYSSDRQEKSQNRGMESPKENETSLQRRKTENFFEKLRREKGFQGAVRYLARICGIMLKKLAWFVKRLKLRGFRLNITVATEDAARTAIEYGLLCTAVYPVLTLLFSLTGCRAKQIDISTDFNVKSPELQFYISVRTQLMIALIAAVSGFREYQKIKDVNLHE